MASGLHTRAADPESALGQLCSSLGHLLLNIFLLCEPRAICVCLITSSFTLYTAVAFLLL